MNGLVQHKLHKYFHDTPVLQKIHSKYIIYTSNDLFIFRYENNEDNIYRAIDILTRYFNKLC